MKRYTMAIYLVPAILISIKLKYIIGAEGLVGFSVLKTTINLE